MWKFCGKPQFPHSFGRYVETVPENMRKSCLSTKFHARKLGEIRYFTQWRILNVTLCFGSPTTFPHLHLSISPEELTNRGRFSCPLFVITWRYLKNNVSVTESVRIQFKEVVEKEKSERSELMKNRHFTILQL